MQRSLRIGKGNERSFGLPCFAHQSSLTLGLRCAPIDIHTFFNKKLVHEKLALGRPNCQGTGHY